MRKVLPEVLSSPPETLSTIERPAHSKQAIAALAVVGERQRRDHAGGAGRHDDGDGVNKLAADVKAAIMQAFCEVRAAEYLRKLARSDPRTFCTLLGKVLPTQVTADANNSIHAIDRIEASRS